MLNQRIELCPTCRTGVEGGGDCACGRERASRRRPIAASNEAELDAPGVVGEYSKIAAWRYSRLALPRAGEPARALEMVRSTGTSVSLGAPRRDMASRVAAPWWWLARILSLQWLP